MARYAVIDVGTNSVKFHIGEKHADGTWTKVVDRADVTRLGEGLDASGGAFTPEAMERTVVAIVGMVAEAQREGAAAVYMPACSSNQSRMMPISRMCTSRIDRTPRERSSWKNGGAYCCCEGNRRRN